MVKSDIEIARAATMKPILEVGAGLGIPPESLDQYGHYKAKISSANYYMTKILSETGSLMSSIMSGAKYYNEYDDKFFDLAFKI